MPQYIRENRNCLSWVVRAFQAAPCPVHMKQRSEHLVHRCTADRMVHFGAHCDRYS